MAGAKESAFANTRVNSAAEKSEPLFVGTMDDYAKTKPDDLKLQRQLKNTIKKCSVCAKVCAFSMTKCNQCGTELPAEVTSPPRLTPVPKGWLTAQRASAPQFSLLDQCPAPRLPPRGRLPAFDASRPRASSRELVAFRARR